MTDELQNPGDLAACAKRAEQAKRALMAAYHDDCYPRADLFQRRGVPLIDAFGGAMLRLGAALQAGIADRAALDAAPPRAVDPAAACLQCGHAARLHGGKCHGEGCTCTIFWAAAGVAGDLLEAPPL